jgi:hypothetical protein
MEQFSVLWSADRSGPTRFLVALTEDRGHLLVLNKSNSGPPASGLKFLSAAVLLIWRYVNQKSVPTALPFLIRNR